MSARAAQSELQLQQTLPPWFEGQATVGFLSKPKTLSEEVDAIRYKFMDKVDEDVAYFAIRYSNLTVFEPSYGSPRGPWGEFQFITRDFETTATSLAFELLESLDRQVHLSDLAQERFAQIELPELTASTVITAATNSLTSVKISGEDIGAGRIMSAQIIASTDVNYSGDLGLKRWENRESNEIKFETIFNFGSNSSDAATISLLGSRLPGYVNTVILYINWIKGDLKSAQVNLCLPSNVMNHGRLFLALGELKGKYAL